jgi:large subunit ribosomal protein L21
MMFAVINAKGYQYVVAKGDKIVIPAILGEPGKEVEFDRVMMLKDNGGALVGKPYVEGAMVKGVIKSNGKLPKVIVYKFVRRENYRRKKGHRQDYSEVEITEIKKGG